MTHDHDTDGSLGEAGARLRALVASDRFRSIRVRSAPNWIGGSPIGRSEIAWLVDELDALLSAPQLPPDVEWDLASAADPPKASAPVVSPPGEHSTRFAWLMERHLSRDSGLLGAIPAGTLVYWDGGHAESFTTDANKAVQWPSEAAAKAQCPPEHYKQWGWRYVEHGFLAAIAAPVVTQEGE